MNNLKKQPRRSTSERLAGTTRAAQLDQFYTRPDVAIRCYEIFQEHFEPSSYQMVEPSAGEGAFFKLMPPGSIAFDIEPKFPGIVQADFLEVELASDRPIAMIGNPPFGKNSSTAVRFFNHAAARSSVIAFILPRTFRKASTENRLDFDFHLVREERVPRDAFLHEGRSFHIPAIFQLWQRREEPRIVRRVETTHPDFEFTAPELADFAIQRVGARAGRLHDDFSMSRSSHHFVRTVRGNVRSIMQGLDFASVSGDVAGNPSLAKSEIVRLYNEQIRPYQSLPGAFSQPSM